MWGSQGIFFFICLRAMLALIQGAECALRTIPTRDGLPKERRHKSSTRGKSGTSEVNGGPGDEAMSAIPIHNHCNASTILYAAM